MISEKDLKEFWRWLQDGKKHAEKMIVDVDKKDNLYYYLQGKIDVMKNVMLELAEIDKPTSSLKGCSCHTPIRKPATRKPTTRRPARK